MAADMSSNDYLELKGDPQEQEQEQEHEQEQEEEQEEHEQEQERVCENPIAEFAGQHLYR